MDASVIRILVEANSGAVAAGMAPGMAAITSFEQTATNSLGKIKGAFDGLSSTTKVMGGIALGAGLVATALGSTIAPAIEFESAFSGVLKTVDGSVQQLQGIRDGILDMSAVMPTAAADLAGIAEAAGQLGVEAPAILEFTETVAMLGETTDLDFEQAAASLAQFLNITGSSTQTVGELADVVVDLGNNSATTESKIVSFGQRLAAAGALLGLTDAEILSVAAAFASMGVEAEAGGTALSRVFKEIFEAALSGGPQLERFAEVAGMTAEEFKNLADNDPAAAFESFVTGLGNISDSGGNIVAVLDDMGFKGERLQAVLLAAAGNSDVLADAIERGNAAYGNGAAAEEYGKKVETTAAQLEILRNKFEAVRIAIGTQFLGGIVTGATAAGDALGFLVDTLGPVLAQLMEFGGDALDGFMFLAGPVLKTGLEAAAVGLMALSTGLELVLTVLNAIPGAAEAVGIYLAVIAGATLVGGISGLAGAFGVLATALWYTSGAATAAGLGMTALAAAAPLIALASLALALRGAGEAAEEAGEAWTTRFSDRIEATDFAGVVADLDELKARMAELDEIDKVSDGWGGGIESWTTAFKSAAQVLTPFTENTVVNARAELEALEEVLEATEVEKYTQGISELAKQLGLTETEVMSAVEALGLQEEAVAAGEVAWNGYEYRLAGVSGAGADAVDAIVDLTVETTAAADAAGMSVDEFGALLDEFSAVATTAQTLADATADLVNQLDILAGTGSDARLALLDLDDALASFQAKLAEDAGYAQTNDGMRDLIDLGGQFQDTLLAVAEAGDYIPGSLAAARESFIQTGVEAGISATLMGELADEAGLIAALEPLYIAIDSNADLTQAEVDALIAALQAYDGSQYEAQAAIDAGMALEDFRALLDAGEGWAVALYEARVEADTDQATRALADLKLIYDSFTNKVVAVTVNTSSGSFTAPVSTYTPATQTSNSSGGNSYQANGSVLEFYRNGGMREQHVAQIAPAGAMRVWAEPETGGESYIPLSPAKRGRSLSIWRETGRRLGAIPMAEGGVLNFANGGITTETFTESNGLPGVTVGVTVNAQALGQVNVDLAPVLGVINDVERSFGSLGAAYEVFGSTATRSSEAVLQSFERIPDAIGFTVASTGDMVAAFDRAGVDISSTVQAISQDILSNMGVDEFINTMVDDFGWAREQFTANLQAMDNDVAEAVRQMAGSGEDLRYVWEGVFLEAADASDVFEIALQDVSRAVDDVDSAMRRAESGFDLITGAVRDGLSAQFDYLDAVDRVKDAIGNGEAFGIVSREARGNYEDLLRAGDAMREYALETAGAGQSAEAAVANFRGLEAEFRAMATAAGLPQAEVAELVDLLFGIPDSVIADIAVKGLEQKAELDEFNQGLELIDAMTATPTIDANADPFGMIAESVQNVLTSFDEAKAEAELGADESGFDEAMAKVAADVAWLDAVLAVAKFEADDVDFSNKISVAQAALEQLDQAIADPDFTADSSAFDQVTAAVELVLGEINNAIATPTVDADMNPFAGVITTVRNDLNVVGSTTETPTVGLNDQASGPISNIAGALNGLKDKTITTTINTVKTVTEKWNPATIPASVWQELGDSSEQAFRDRMNSYALGGFVGDIENGHKAQMAPAGAMRVWAEPETGGESYIPHANDYRRGGALEVLEQTANLFGRRVVPMAQGGMFHAMAGGFVGGGGIVMAPGAVSVSVSGANATPSQLERIAENAVKRGLDSWSRNLNRELSRRT